MIEHPTIESGTDNKAKTLILHRDNAAGEYEDHYQFTSYPLCIRSNEREISQLFKGLYAYYHTEKPLTGSIVFTIHRNNRDVTPLKQTPHRTPSHTEAGVAGQQADTSRQGDNPAYALSESGKVVFRGGNPVAALAFLEWFVINAVVRKNLTHIMFHASALAFGNTGVIFPASSGSGKTTIALALIAQGFQYLSDEVAMIDAEDFTLRPLPRGLAIRENAFHLLQSLNKPPPSIGFYPQSPPTHFRYFNPTAFTHQAIEQPVSVRHVIFLDKPAVSTKTHLKKIPKAQAVSQLLSCSFANRPLAEDNIAHCIKLSQRTDCYTLTGGNLQERVNAVLDVFHGL
ncbi:MAG TPA: hypothetical protein VJ440_14310 [Candidatus Brocadiaceae bacterium]|nr:hypothetical protein [Candidatus Brocadiaceae bacterium]